MHTIDAAPVRRFRCDWPTALLLVGFTVVWGSALALPAGHGALAFVILVLALTLHSSLSHEILHGHPFGRSSVETAIGLWQPGLFVPYLRFKRQHLAHHRDANLTDPYDDPETNYLDPAVWGRLPAPVKTLLRVNNTLAGRIVIGPAVGMVAFVRGDISAWRAGDRTVLRDWLLHLPGVTVTLGAVAVSPLDLTVYLGACYGALSVLKIRTFLEHRAHDRAPSRTAIVEDRGPLAFLFLNNNLHVVHHMHPDLPWYRLRATYSARRDRYLGRNGGYVYRSYGAVFRAHLLRAKDPVPHPHWPRP